MRLIQRQVSSKREFSIISLIDTHVDAPTTNLIPHPNSYLH